MLPPDNQHRVLGLPEDLGKGMGAGGDFLNHCWVFAQVLNFVREVAGGPTTPIGNLPMQTACADGR